MLRFLLIVLLSTLLAGCSLPRIIVLNDPLTAEQHNDLGVAYQQRQDFDLALRAFSRAADLDKSWAQPLVNSGNVHAALDDWRQAEGSYRQALRRQKDDAGAMNNLAWVLLRQDELDDALHWAQQAALLDPQAAVLDTLAEVHLAREEYADAAPVVARALALEPTVALRQELEEKSKVLRKAGW
jgi:tetratricopeptide (TPR) repeat protein